MDWTTCLCPIFSSQPCGLSSWCADGEMRQKNSASPGPGPPGCGEDKSGSENPEPELLLQQDGAKPPGWAWDTMHPGTALHFHPKASYYYTSYSYAWSPKMLFSWPGWWKNPIFTGNNFTKFCYFFLKKCLLYWWWIKLLIYLYFCYWYSRS